MRLFDPLTALWLWLLLLPLCLVGRGLLLSLLAVLLMCACAVGLRFYLLATAKSRRNTLNTMAYSHFTERAYWALQLAGVDFQEEQDIGIVGVLATGRTVPKLEIPADKVVLGDSTAILRYIYASSLGTENEARCAFLKPTAEIVALEKKLCDVLGERSRRWLYYHLLPHTELVFQAWGGLEPRVPAWQRTLLKLIMPWLIQVLRKLLNIDAEAAKRSLERVKELFAELDKVFADGRPYLFGDKMTVADITLASLGYISVWYEDKGGASSLPLPSLNTLPTEMEDFVREVRVLRETKTGQFIKKMYQQHRKVAAADAAPAAPKAAATSAPGPAPAATAAAAAPAPGPQTTPAAAAATKKNA